MRRTAIILALASAPFAAGAQQDGEEPGFFDRLFGTDQADSDAEQGTLLERLIQDSLSGNDRTVSVEGFSGALTGEATLDRLTISDPEGIWLTLEDAVLDWNRSALFRGRLEVEEIVAARIDLPRLAAPAGGVAPSPEANGYALPDLPVSIQIGRIGAEAVYIGAPVFGAQADVSIEGSFSLSDGEGTADLSMLRLDGTGGVTLEASYANATQNLALNLSLQEEADGIFVNLVDLPGLPSVDFSVQSDAPLSDYTARIRLATDGTERIEGQVMLQTVEGEQRVAADIGGDIAPVLAPAYRPFFGDAIRLTTKALIGPDGSISVPEFALTAQSIALSGTVEIGADRLPQSIAVTGQIVSDDGSPVLLPISGAETEVDRVDLDIAFDASRSEDWTGDITIQSLVQGDLTVDRTALTGSGRIVPGETATVTADFQFGTVGLETGIAGLSELIGRDLSGETRVFWNGGPIVIDELDLIAQNLRATGQAEIAMNETGPQFRGALDLVANRLADFSSISGRDVSGTAKLATTFDVLPLSQTFDISAKGTTIDAAISDDIADAILAGEARLDLQATRDEDGVRIRLNRLASAAVDLTAAADLRSGGSSLGLEGQLIDTSLLFPSLSGPSRVSLNGMEDDARDWTIKTSLTGPTFAASLDGTFSDLFNAPFFAGEIGVKADDLAPFSELAGRSLRGSLIVDAKGRIASNLSNAELRAQLDGSDLSVGMDELDALLAEEVSVIVNASKSGSAIEIAELDFTSPRLSASVNGKLNDLSATPSFTGKVEANAKDLAAFSRLAGRPLRGRLNVDADASIMSDMSNAKLRAEIKGSGLSIGQAEADRLLAGNLAATVDATKIGDLIEIAGFDLSTNLLQASANGKLANRDTEIAINARLRDIAAFVDGISGPLSVTGSLGRKDTNLLVDLEATGPGGARGNLNGTVAEDFATANLDATGTAPLGLANRFILPRSLTGNAAFSLRLNGPPAMSNLSGQVSTSGTRLSAPTVGVSLSNLSGRIDLSGEIANLDFTSNVDGGGLLGITGPVGLSSPNISDISVQLTNVALSDARLYETAVNGRIRVNGPLAGGATISGGLNLGETNIRIPDSGFGGANAVPEIIHLSEPPPVRGTRRRAGLLESSGRGSSNSRVGAFYLLDVLVNAPNRIFVRGRGLDSEFGGNLRIGGTTNDVIPQGAFELIRGRLDILGQRLNLEDAQITMRGDFVPYIILRASTDADEYRVNIDVEGQADSPEIKFSSSPELPQEEVLSRLLFGRGLETLSPLQAARLALAVRTLAGQGGEGVVDRIRNSTGLADLDVTTTEDGNAAVRAGAYLGENVYTDVTVDSAGETELNLNLDITPSLTARGGVSSEGDSSFGIFFERDY